MGIGEYIKSPEGIITGIGIAVGGYFVGNWLREKVNSYFEKTGQEIGRNIAREIKTQSTMANGGYELDVTRVYKALDDLSSRIANIEKRLDGKNA